jgi:hypothetical protein
MQETKKSEPQIKVLSETEKKIAKYEKELLSADGIQAESIKAEIEGLKKIIGG